jgi:plasmid stabilization system protein ParE
MMKVEWSKIALFELDEILQNARSPRGRETLRRAMRRAEKKIALAPYTGRFDRKRDLYEAVVTRVQFLIFYRVANALDGAHARIVGVFNTNRDPQRKPRRRR